MFQSRIVIHHLCDQPNWIYHCVGVFLERIKEVWKPTLKMNVTTMLLGKGGSPEHHNPFSAS